MKVREEIVIAGSGHPSCEASQKDGAEKPGRKPRQAQTA
jgi:hypothetical protein